MSIRCLSLDKNEESVLVTALVGSLVAKEKLIQYKKESYSDTCLFIDEHFQESAWLAVSRVSNKENTDSIQMNA